MIKCKHCGAEVPQTSQRVRLYCNDKCRKAFKRSDNGQINNLITDKPITDNRCKGCGEIQPSNLVDICYKCLAKGLTRESIGLKPTQHQRWLLECQAVV